MKVKYYYGTTPIIIDKGNRYLKLPEYEGLVPGDYHVVCEYDFRNKDSDDIKSSVGSLRRFINEELSKDHEYYNILKDLIYSDDKNNYLIALKIINQI